MIRGAGWQPGWELGPVDRPAGGLIASVEHLMTWCRFQWTGTALDGSPILTPESLARLHTPIVTATVIEDIAIDWFVWDIDGARAIGHGGLTAGYASDLVVVPELDFAFVGLTNGTNGGLGQRLGATVGARTVRRAPRGRPAPRIPSSSSRPRASPDGSSMRSPCSP